MCHENQTDLLEQYDTLPESVQKIIMEMIHSYDGIKEANEKLKKIGYSFEYGLDAEPYNLRKI
jgi:hypothetical protein